jgi:uncharacterized protein
MIMVDTGPLVALFDPKDAMHSTALRTLKGLRESLMTTVAVLTETFHMLQPDSIGSDRLRDFVMQGGLDVWFFNRGALQRTFELMDQYSDQSMDLADASIIVAAEALQTLDVFTLRLCRISDSPRSSASACSYC